MYYPYTQTVASVSTMPFGVSADQSSLGAYKSSDLIVGSTLDAAPSASPVNIAARHLMSQVEIVLKAGAGYSESSLAEADVSVKMNNLVTSATVDIATSTVSANGSVRSLTPYKDGAVYRAFVVPQTATGNNLITITVDGTDHNISKTVLHRWQAPHAHRHAQQGRRRTEREYQRMGERRHRLRRCGKLTQ